jgi:hypothetical protein
MLKGSKRYHALSQESTRGQNQLEVTILLSAVEHLAQGVVFGTIVGAN